MSSSEPAPPVDGTRRIELQATALSVVGGLIHAMLSPTHLEEWWGYGLFFFFAAALQIIYGVALGGGVFQPGTWKGDWVQARRNFLMLGIAGNTGIILVYLVSRTTGIPFLGPSAGTPEDIGFVDAVSKIIEVVLIAWLVRLLRRVPTAAGSATPGA